MRAAVLSNGQVTDYEYIMNLIAKADLLICADGGGLHALKMGLKPDVLLGDFDSLNEKTVREFEISGTKVIRYKSEKDQTDTQLAVEYAVESGADEIALFGCTGSRLDHTYANISILIWLAQKKINGVIIDRHNEIRIVDKYIKLSGDVGDFISLLAVTPKVDGVTTKGLKYALKDGELRNDNTLGVSNEFMDAEAEIWVKDGVLMVIKSKD